MKNTVNSRLVDLLKTSGLDEKEVANRTGIDYSTIYRITSGETKKPFKNNLKAIADCIGANYDYLITGQGEKYLKKESENPWKDALVSQLKDEANSWQEKYNQVWKRLEFMMDRMPMGKFKTLRYTGSQKERLRVGVN